MQVKISTSPLTTDIHDTREIKAHLRKMIREKYKGGRLRSIGSGCYAEVFQHPHQKDRVIKLALMSPRYAQYAVWCARNQDNPYVPRLESIEIFDIHTSGYCKQAVIVVMEKLRKSRTENGHLGEVLRFLSCMGCASAQLRKSKTFDQLSALRSYLRETVGGIPDMHLGNVLKRGDQPVVIDPVIG